MRKRINILGILLVLFLMLSSTCQVHAEETGNCGDNATWSYNESTKTLTIEGTGAINNYNFENVPWLSFRESIEKVVVGEGITKIGDYTFYWFKALEDVTLPDGLLEIGFRGFSQTGISQINLPDSVTTVGDYAFANCSNLTVFQCSDDLDLGNPYTKFESSPCGDYIQTDYRFDGIDRLLVISKSSNLSRPFLSEEIRGKVKTAVIKGDITSVGNDAFYNFTSLENITLPDSVVTIGNNAFANTALSSFILPESLTTIGYYAFEGTKLKEFTLPETLTSVDNSIFKNCTELEEVIILCSCFEPRFNGCTSLKTLVLNGGPISSSTSSGFLYGNETLENLTLGEKVTSIGDNAFGNCTSLKSVTIENGLTAIGQLSFQNCSALLEINIPSTVESIGYKSFDGCTSLEKVTFNDGLVSIAKWAFNACPALSEVSIPKTVTEIGEYAFHGCLRWYADNEGEKEYDHYYAYDTPFIMKGYTNSVAQEYAMEPKYKITFESLGVLTCDDIGHQAGEAVRENKKEATCVNAGKYDSVVYCTACEEEISRETINIPAKGHNYSTSWTIDKKATTTANGSKSKHCKNCDAKTNVTTIRKASKVSLGTATYVYNGKQKNPTVIVKDSAGNKIATANYTVTKPTGRKNVGKYTYKIKFKNAYSGTKSLTLTINPKGTTVSSLTKARKAFTVKWKKQSEKMATSRITGYEIQYSTSKKFTSSKKATVKGYGTVSKKITGLKAKTIYYVRIRTYKTVTFNGKSVKLYSGWSAAKNVKTK